MLKTALIVLLIGIVTFELIEHVVLPLVFAVFGRKRKVVTGAEGMLGRVVEVTRWDDGEGTVNCAGELWRATGPHSLAPEDKARVLKVEGLRLSVTPLKHEGDDRHRVRG